MTDAWQRMSAHGDGWYWIAVHARFGDLFQICTLAAPFRAHHGTAYPIKLVVSYEVYLPIVALFGDVFDDVIIEPHLPNTVEGWRELVAEDAWPPFRPNVPLMLQPNIDASAGQLTTFANRFGISWTKVYKHVLHLPDAIAPALPPRRPDVVAAAERWCADNKLIPGRTVILFPYAQSFPVDCRGHFAALAAALAAAGYEVVTSVAPREEAIPGTRGVFIPFPILIEVADQAGWAVIIRSGIADILAAAACRKTVIYQDIHNLRVWSLRALELCRDAEEIVVDFGATSSEQFVDAVVQPADLGAVLAPPGALSAMVEAGLYGRVVVDRARFAALQRSDARMDEGVTASARAIEAGGVSVLRDVPARNDPYRGDGAGRLAQRLAALVQQGAHAYATEDRDQGGALETLTAGSLRAGGYLAADGPHTLILSAAPLPALLAPAIARFVAPIRTMPTGETVAIALATRDAETMPLSATNPQSFVGLQLVQGWCGVEDWGAWSLGLRSVIRVTFENPARVAATLRLRYHPFLSAGAPELGFAVDVDGVPQQHVRVRHGEDVPELVVPLAPPAGTGLQSHLIALGFDAVRTPREQGFNDDDRQLAIGLRFARVDLADS